MRYLRALTAVSALVVLVAGIPALLALTVGNPLAGWPDLVAADLSDAVFVDVLAAVAYLAWAQFALAVLAETLCLLTGLRPPSRLFVVPVSQRRLARALLAAAFLLSPAASTPFTTTSTTPPAQVVATAPLAVTAATTPMTNDVAATAQQTPRVEAADHRPTYTIRADGPGTYWDLAEHFLGDGQHWPQIWQLNDGRRQGDGTVMTSPGLLRPGWTVLLPASATNVATDPAPDPATGAHTDTPRGEVTVKAGDSLWSIAEAHQGDGRSWPELYRLNRGQPQPDGGRLTDPDLIQPGWVLRLPHDHAGSGAPSRTPPTPSRPGTTQPPSATPTPAPSPTSEPGTPQPSTAEPSAAEPSTTSAASVNGVPRPEPTTSPAASPAHRAGSATGVDLPAGWVTIPFAAAISAAGALVWLRRRRRHRYAPLEDLDLTGDGLDPDDPDLQPLPVIVHRMRRAVREHAPRLLDPPPPQPTVTEYVADPTRYRPAPDGPTGPDLTGLTDLAHSDGLGLTGPGADAAARALLVAALSAGGPHDPDASSHVIIPSPTLEVLLGDDAPAGAEIPRLRVTADLTQALDLLESEHLQRLRTLDEYDAEDITQLRAADPAYPPMPPLVLLTHTPPEDLRARLTALIHLGTAVDIRAVLLGEWPPGTTLDVAADGTTTTGSRAHRVATLDATSTLELLGVLREAHTSEPAHHSPAETTDADDAKRTDAQAPDTGEANSTNTTEIDPQEGETDPTGAHGAPNASQDPDRVPSDLDMTTDVGTPRPLPSRPQRVAIRVLGHIAVLDQRGKPVPGLRQHAGGLLAYLAIHRTGADKTEIMEAIWPEASLRRAAERLSTEVGNLRRCIRQAAVDQDTQPVINTGGRYHLDPSLVDVDAWAFQDALHRATTANDPAQRREALHAAVAAHAGPLADRRDYRWLEPAREQIRRHGIRAQLHLADLISADDPQQAADLAKAAATLDPTNEELARLAMGAHARVGDTLAVTARLRHLRAALRDIDEEPSPETLALAAQLQPRDARATPPAAPAMANGHDPTQLRRRRRSALTDGEA